MQIDTSLNPDGDPAVDTPLSDEEFKHGRVAMLARRARQTTGLSQIAFSATIDVPVATVRDWEQGRRAPDAAAITLLKLVKKDPTSILNILKTA